jgi:hypothetical protein
MIRDDGNVGIGTNNPGAKLEINGSGNTSTTKSFTLRNSTSLLLDVTDDGIFSYGTNGPQMRITGSNGVLNNTGQNLNYVVRGLADNDSGTGNVNYIGFTYQGTTGNNNVFVSIARPFAPTSGNAVLSQFCINPTINQTGTANGATIGIRVIPTITNAVEWRSIQWDNISGFGLYGSGTAANYLNGNLGIKTTSPTDLIDINGANGYSQLRLRTAYTPTGTADANGNTGDVGWDADYIYIKTAAGWKRSALSTF